MKTIPKSRVLEKGIWGMSVPMFVDQAVIYTIPIVDMFFLSRVSDSAAAAVGAITPLVFVANAFLVITAFAGASIANQYIGAKNYQQGNATISAYAYLVFLLALIAGVTLSLCGPWVASSMLLSDAVEKDAHEYLSVIGWMLGFWGFRVIYQTILNIYGEPQWNTVSNIILFFVNLIGNAIAVYGFGFIEPSGVAGVAWASVISAIASLLFVMVIVHFKLKLHFPWRQALIDFKSLIVPVAAIAAPAILEPVSFQSYMIALNWIAADVGDLELKAKIYAYNTFLFCLMISIAIGMATEAIIAQRVGQKEFDLVESQLRQSLKISVIGTSLLALIWFVFHKPILHLFTQDQAIIAIGFWAFFISCITEPWRTVNIVIGSSLRCTGDATFSSVSAILVIWLFSIPLAYILAITCGWGLYGLLIAALADEFIRAIIKFWRWRQKKWMTKGVAYREPMVS
jgi:putative MATE family efflux protein